MRAILIPADGPCREIDVDWEGIGALVAGPTQDRGYMQAVPFCPGANLEVPATLYVNEDGLHLALPENPRARWLTRYPGRVVGDAVLLGPVDPDAGEDTPVDPEAAVFINRIVGVRDAEGRLFADDWDGTAEHRAFHPTEGMVA